jgi:hypothetical protein
MRVETIYTEKELHLRSNGAESGPATASKNEAKQAFLLEEDQKLFPCLTAL